MPLNWLHIRRGQKSDALARKIGIAIGPASEGAGGTGLRFYSIVLLLP